jgi:chromosomal replication initiation ATPase DnaA
VKLAEEAELWHAPDKTVYASVVTDSYRDDWELNGTGFRHWLTETFHKKYDKAPTANAIKDAIGVLASKGSRNGNQYPVFTRVAEEDGRIYLDLANQARQVVEIDAYGWRVLDISPVRFKRSESMRPLPEPRKGNLNTLRDFLNFGPGDDAVWALYAACLVQALRGDSHYPPLVIYGEHGSAKTTAAKMYRRLIDPNKSDLRSAQE